MTGSPRPFEVGTVLPTDQYAAHELPALAVEAERHGFDGVCVQDRFQPWLPRHGRAPHVWAVLGAVGARTEGFLAATAVPGGRSHPVTLAQAAGTIAAMFPGRHRLALVAGDAIDEHVVGEYWPEAPERMTRLFEAVDVVRKLFATPRKGGDVRHRGEHFRVETARLWGAPDVPPPLQVWVGGAVSAKRAGRSADGIVVPATRNDRFAAIVAAAREGAGEAGRDPQDVRVAAHLQVCWAASDSEAEAQALTEWPMPGLRFPRSDIRSPFDVEHLIRGVRIEDIRESMPVGSDPAVHLGELERLRALGADTVHVHNVGLDQVGWFEVFGAHIRPALQETARQETALRESTPGERALRGVLR